MILQIGGKVWKLSKKIKIKKKSQRIKDLQMVKFNKTINKSIMNKKDPNKL